MSRPNSSGSGAGTGGTTTLKALKRKASQPRRLHQKVFDIIVYSRGGTRSSVGSGCECSHLLAPSPRCAAVNADCAVYSIHLPRPVFHPSLVARHPPLYARPALLRLSQSQGAPSRPRVTQRPLVVVSSTFRLGRIRLTLCERTWTWTPAYSAGSSTSAASRLSPPRPCFNLYRVPSPRQYLLF